jgi:hypothetical protein
MGPALASTARSTVWGVIWAKCVASPTRRQTLLTHGGQNCPACGILEVGLSV